MIENMGRLLVKKYANAVEMYEKGMSVGELAAFFQVTRQAMWNALRVRGCKMRSKLRYKEKNHFYRGGSRAEDRAHNMVELALEKGVLVRPELCEKCGGRGNSRGIQAHHPDYNKPLDVVWLCQPCHHEWHKHNKAVPLATDLPKMSQREIASLGGKASAAKMTKEQRQERTRKALKARWQTKSTSA